MRKFFFHKVSVLVDSAELKAIFCSQILNQKLLIVEQVKEIKIRASLLSRFRG